MPSRYFTCIVPGCGNSSAINPHEAFFQLPKTMNILNEWVRNMNLPDLVHKPESTRRHYKVCTVHFDDSCFQTPEKKKLNRGVVPTIFNMKRDLILPKGISSYQEAIPVSPTTQAVPSKKLVTSELLQTAFGDEMGTIALRTSHGSKNAVIQEVDVTEFVKGSVRSIFNNGTIANSKESLKPVETNENDLETQLEKIFEEPEVTPAPILFVSSFADYKEEVEVLTSSNIQPDSDSDILKEIIVQNPRYTGQCNAKDLDSPMKTERNWNLAMNEISALRKKLNIVQNQNSRLDRRVKSMKTLLRHFKKTHAR